MFYEIYDSPNDLRYVYWTWSLYRISAYCGVGPMEGSVYVRAGFILNMDGVCPALLPHHTAPLTKHTNILYNYDSVTMSMQFVTRSLDDGPSMPFIIII